jgi:hypothetical protein
MPATVKAIRFMSAHVEQSDSPMELPLAVAQQRWAGRAELASAVFEWMTRPT